MNAQFLINAPPNLWFYQWDIFTDFQALWLDISHEHYSLITF